MIFGFGSQPMPNVGGTAAPMALPCLSTTCAEAWMFPTAASTVGVWETTLTREAGMFGR